MFSHRGRQPDVGRGPRPAGRARRWRATTSTLGKFHLDGIPPAPRGVPQIEVTFDIDANGILQRLGEGQGDRQGRAEVASTARSGLNEQEIKRMVEGRRRARGRGQGAPRGDRAPQPARHAGLPDGEDLNENKAKLPAEDKLKIEEALKEAEEVPSVTDDAASEALTQLASERSHVEAMHVGRCAAYGGGGGGDSGRRGGGGGDEAEEGRRHRRRVRRGHQLNRTAGCASDRPTTDPGAIRVSVVLLRTQRPPPPSEPRPRGSGP